MKGGLASTAAARNSRMAASYSLEEQCPVRAACLSALSRCRALASRTSASTILSPADGRCLPASVSLDIRSTCLAHPGRCRVRDGVRGVLRTRTTKVTRGYFRAIDGSGGAAGTHEGRGEVDEL